MCVAMVVFITEVEFSKLGGKVIHLHGRKKNAHVAKHEIEGRYKVISLYWISRKYRQLPSDTTSDVSC